MHKRIESRQDYIDFLLADQNANHYQRKWPLPFYDYVWVFLRIMRSLEYMENCHSKNKLWKAIQKFRFRQYSIRLGISIHPNTFGKGLTLWHWGSIVVHPHVDGGDYVTIQAGVNISHNVIIEDNVYLAPGAKVLENVSIRKGVIVGANGVVVHSIQESFTSWGGIPVRKLSDKGNIVRGCDG